MGRKTCGLTAYGVNFLTMDKRFMIQFSFRIGELALNTTLSDLKWGFVSQSEGIYL